MIDELINIVVKCHLVVFAIFIDDGLPIYVFLDLLFIVYRFKDTIVMYERFINNLKERGLDFNKFIGFWSDRVLTMVGKKNRIFPRLKNSIYF